VFAVLFCLARQKTVVKSLEQQQPDYEAGLDPGPSLVAVERRDLLIDPVPIDLAGEGERSNGDGPSRRRSVRRLRPPGGGAPFGNSLRK
jgi:hypothetical protein